MSTGKLIWAVVIVILLGAAYWYWSSGKGAVVTPPNGSGTSMSSPSDTSDAALDQDTAAVDAQLSAAAADSTSADNSLNDKPVTQ